MCDFEQTRPRPVMLTENDVLIDCGTRSLMVSPVSQHVARGCGVQRLSPGENVYISVCDREMHVSLLLSFRRNLSCILAGGSNTVTTRNVVCSTASRIWVSLRYCSPTLAMFIYSRLTFCEQVSSPWNCVRMVCLSLCGNLLQLEMTTSGEMRCDPHE